ncbi:unnamed protein product, partial [Rhizoctonia solani]
MQAIRARVNSFRSRLRDKLKPTIATVYKLVADELTPEEAKKKIAALFPHTFHTKVGAAKGRGHFQRGFLQQAVFEAYFTGLNPVAISFPKLFDPMPLEAIALVLSVIKWVIHQHETGKYVKTKMSFEMLREYYTELMKSLKAFQTGKQADRCAIVQKTLYVRSMELAGRPVDKGEAEPTGNVLGDDDFAEDIPTEEELKMLGRGSTKPRRTSDSPNRSATRATSSPSNTSEGPRATSPDRGSPKPARPGPIEPPHAPSPRSSIRSSPPCRERASSVSLDFEESEGEREATPTPSTRKRPLASGSRAVNTSQASSNEDDEDKEVEEQ